MVIPWRVYPYAQGSEYQDRSGTGESRLFTAAQVPAGQIVYIDNTPMFVHIAESLGIQSILHTDCESTRAKLASLGLRNDEGGTHGAG